MFAPYCRLNAGKDRKKSVRIWFKSHGSTVHAISQAGFCRTIGENMPEMPVTGRATHFDPPHAEAIVFDLGDCVAVGRYREAWPAATTVELAFGIKQFAAATGAEKFTFAIFRVQRASESPLGASFAQHMILFGRQFLPPLFVAQSGFFHF